MEKMERNESETHNESDFYTVYTKEKKVLEKPLDKDDKLVIYFLIERYHYFTSKTEVKYRNEEPDIEEPHMNPVVSIHTQSRPELYRTKKWALERFEETVRFYEKKGINVKIKGDDKDNNRRGGLNRHLKIASIPVSEKDLRFRHFNGDAVIYCKLVISIGAEFPFDE